MSGRGRGRGTSRLLSGRSLWRSRSGGYPPNFNEILDLYSECRLLKYGNGDKDEERDNAVEATELECLHNYNNILDEVINHIMTKLSGDNKNLVYNEAFENKMRFFFFL